MLLPSNKPAKAAGMASSPSTTVRSHDRCRFEARSLDRQSGRHQGTLELPHHLVLACRSFGRRRLTVSAEPRRMRLYRNVRDRGDGADEVETGGLARVTLDA